MNEPRRATARLTARDEWFLTLDSACCLIRAVFSWEQIRENFLGTGYEIGGLALLVALVLVTISAGVLTSKQKAPGRRFVILAVLLVVVSMSWELSWMWFHLETVAYGDLAVTCLLVPVRICWNILYGVVVINVYKPTAAAL